MQFIVPQQKGKDSTVTITEETVTNWPEDKNLLIFETDQSLLSQSGRALNVQEFIENYARPKGYQLPYPRRYDEKYKAVFTYDARFHSSIGEFQIRTKVQKDRRYQEAATAVKEQRDTINKDYSKAIRQLKNLTFALEKKNDEQLESVKQKLINIQVSLIQEIDIPEYIQEYERKDLLKPDYPYTEIKSDNYYRNQEEGLPDSIDWMLELL